MVFREFWDFSVENHYFLSFSRFSVFTSLGGRTGSGGAPSAHGSGRVLGGGAGRGWGRVGSERGLQRSLSMPYACPGWPKSIPEQNWQKYFFSWKSWFSENFRIFRDFALWTQGGIWRSPAWDPWICSTVFANELYVLYTSVILLRPPMSLPKPLGTPEWYRSIPGQFGGSETLSEASTKKCKKKSKILQKSANPPTKTSDLYTSKKYKTIWWAGSILNYINWFLDWRDVN